MTQDTDAARILARLAWPIRATWAGLWAERLARAFWPAWSLALAALAALAFGVQDHLPLALAQGLVGGAGLALAVLVALGLRRFRRPLRAEALARLDAALPGRPLAALTDTQAIGAGDPASAAVWAAHLARMAARAQTARPVQPDLRLASRDRYALRYAALTALVMAALFGSVWRAGSVTALTPGAGPGLSGGPVWEGWAQPPAYTGRPSLYLPDLAAGTLELPVGTRLSLRLYGAVGALRVEQDIAAPEETTARTVAEAPAQDFVLAASGRLAVVGPGGREWQIVALPDRAPTVALAGEITRETGGRLNQPFTAADDYGVVAGQARFALDLAAVDRRHGLAIDPEPRDPVTLDLPMPLSGDRAQVAETLVDDLSKHPFANLPVRLSLQAEDAAGQIGLSDPVAVVLPGRRFFDPLAAAVIELRRDLLWSAGNAPRTAQILRAITHRPEDILRSERAFLRLRVLMRDLDRALAQGPLPPDRRDAFAEALWEIALLIEEGDLASALERLRRAQDRLDEAIRNGADPSEIQELMDDLRQALDDYMRQLAQEAERNGGDPQMQQDLQGMQMSGRQLQEMLDQLQQLMEEGRMAEAAELMEMLRQLMENMQVTQGQGGQGQGSPGQQALRDLSETLRDQQGLSDDSFRQLQDQFGRQEQPGDRPGRDLADRQQALRDRLNGLENLPGAGSRAGEAGRQALDRAGRAMDGAEEALRDGDLAGALDRQAEALEAMREGLRNFGEALAEEQNGRQPQPGRDPGQAFGQADPDGQRDPLGRARGELGRLGSDRNMLQGEDVYRRAQDLLEELRRRSADQTRPEAERDYLKRLLERF